MKAWLPILVAASLPMILPAIAQDGGSTPDPDAGRHFAPIINGKDLQPRGDPANVPKHDAQELDSLYKELMDESTPNSGPQLKRQ